MPANSVSGEAPFPGCLLAVTSLGRRGQGSLLSLLYKGTNPIHTGSSLHDLIISRRPCLPSTVTLELGFQHLNLGGHEMRPWQIPHGSPCLGRRLQHGQAILRVCLWLLLFPYPCPKSPLLPVSKVLTTGLGAEVDSGTGNEGLGREASEEGEGRASSPL